MEKTEQHESMSSDLGEIILYQSEDGQASLDVHLKDETIWLTLNQMAELFGRDKSVISRHLRNVFQSGELAKEATVAKNATVQSEGDRCVTRQVEWYNLDAIISVGYRVNSKRGTQFRIWATSVLKEHLVRGYSLNRQRLAEKGVEEVRQVLRLLAETLESRNLVSDEGRAVLEVVSRYARTWRLLLQYDEDDLSVPKKIHETKSALDIDRVRLAIAGLKKELAGRGEATDIFGLERGEGLAGIIGTLLQTFGGQELYPSVEEKAAHLLYFVIKDHPFVDGNKRVGSFLFILFLQTNGLFDKGMDFDNRALVVLALLTAGSESRQKELMIRLIMNLIAEEG